jgi:recombination protein RecT
MNEPTKALTIAEEFGTRRPQFEAALPKHMPVKRFVRIALTAVQMNPKLATADRASFWTACMRAAQDGLLPDNREGALVIYSTKIDKTTWIDKVVWMPMIAGLRKKVRNSEEIATWDVHAVHAKDKFDYEEGDEPYIKHKPYMPKPLERSGAESDEQYKERLRAHIDPGPLTFAYSIAVLKTGEKSRDVMTRFEIDNVRDTYSKRDRDGNFTPMWVKSYDEAAKKTVARRHSKVLPMSTDLDDLLRRDDELYDLKGASDKLVAGPRPKSLADRIDALVGIEDIPPHDVETGEIIEQVSGERLPETPAGGSGSPVGARDAGRRGSSPRNERSEGPSPSPSSAQTAETNRSASSSRGRDEPPPPDDSPPYDNGTLDRVALLQDLMRTGERIAREQGTAALDRWLDDDLNGDEQAAMTVGHTRKLKQIAAEGERARG